MFITGEAAIQMAKGFTGAKSAPRKSQVPCPDCKSNMVFTESGVIHHCPPRRRVKCPSCGYKGFHLVDLPDNSLDISNQVKVTRNDEEGSHKPQECSETLESAHPEDTYPCKSEHPYHRSCE